MENKACNKLHPQSMCPAFGGLRVLMRIDGTQVCMAADQGCLYGLTFVSHFYVARRSIVSPELMNVQISGGTMIDDLRRTIEKIAEDPSVRFIPVVSTCVAETAGIAEELLPKRVGNAEVLLVRLPAFQIRTHPEAKDVAVSSLVRRFGAFDQPRNEKTLVVLGEIFPVDAMMIGGVSSGSACSRSSPCRAPTSTTTHRRVGPQPAPCCTPSTRRRRRSSNPPA